MACTRNRPTCCPISQKLGPQRASPCLPDRAQATPVLSLVYSPNAAIGLISLLKGTASISIPISINGLLG